jgi:DNA-directed RNA polymerase subunit omega
MTKKGYSEHEVIEKVGGRFKLTTLLEKRYRELLFGARPLVDVDSEDPMDILIAEVVEDKIELVPETDAIAAATAALLGDTAARPAKDRLEKPEDESAEDEGESRDEDEQEEDDEEEEEEEEEEEDEEDEDDEDEE